MSTPDARRSHVIALWLAITVTVLWSSSWVLIRFGLDDEDLSPITFAGLRYGLAAVVLCAVVAARPAERGDVRRLERRDLAQLALLGSVFYAATQGAQFVAIDNQPAATTSLVLALTPLLVALAASRSIGEPAAGRQLVGGGLVAGGALLYAAGDLGATAVGMTAAVIGLLANVSAAILGRHVNRSASVSPIVVTAVSMTIGAAMLVAVGVATEGLPSVSGRAWLLVGWLAVVNTAAAFTLWNAALRHLSATESAGINNTMLIQIGLLAWVFLDEFPGGLGLIGIAVVSLGISLTQLPPPRRSS